VQTQWEKEKKKSNIKFWSCRFLGMVTTFHRNPHVGMGFCLHGAAEATQFSPDC